MTRANDCNGLIGQHGVSRYETDNEICRIDMEKRYRLQFFGRVQGVGFRYTATHAANMFRLTGYVKNEYDGSVTCEVQGRDEDIDKFIDVIYRGRFIEVDYIDRTPIDTVSDERSFDVKF